MDRRRFLQTAVAGGAMATGFRSYAEPAFPSRPITMVVAYSPGGGTDTLTRALSKPLAKALGQSVVVENKAGASEIIASEYVAGAKPDGYTLLVCSVPHVTNPSLRTLPYDTVNDFSAVCLAAQSPFVLVVKPDSPIKSLADLVTIAKTRKLSFASSGIGTADHMSTELFCYITGISMTHVPYKGTGPGLVDLMGGHVDIYFANIVGAAPLVKSGKLRAIAVTTEKRSSLLPELPTVQEFTKKPFDVSAWTGILAPAGTPDNVLNTLSKSINSSLRDDSVTSVMATYGAEIVANSPAEFRRFINNEVKKWAEVIKATNIKV